VPTRRVGKKRKDLKRQGQGFMAEMTGILVETLSISGALLLKVSGTEEQETQRLSAKADELMEVSLRHNLVGRHIQANDHGQVLTDRRESRDRLVGRRLRQRD